MTAELTFHLIDTAILTALVSLFVLWRYRVAVLDGMTSVGPAAIPLPELFLLDQRPSEPAAASLQWEKRRKRAVASAYVIATFICILPLAFVETYELSDPRPMWASDVLMLALVYVFICAPMIANSVAPSAWRALLGVVWLAVVLTALAEGTYQLERSLRGLTIGWDDLRSRKFLGLILSQLWFIALMLLTTWPRRLRGVAPMTFAALSVFTLVPFFASRLTGALHPDSAPWGLNGIFVLLTLPVAWLAWERLQYLARNYEAKRFSDAQLLARTWWLILVVNVALQAANGTHHPWLVAAAAITAMFTFAPASALLLSAGCRASAECPSRKLLLLRVFGHTARTERLFDRVGARWRLFGPVLMIAAPDVAARTVHPGDYLRWLTGRIDEIFVNSDNDLKARLAAIDATPDPDGRYRVNAFCCRDATWQATVIELMRRSDAVVMDVRGISQLRHGCQFELEQLACRVPPQKLVLVVDATTERVVLESAFGPALEAVRTVEITGWRRRTDAIFETLLEAAA